MAAWRSTIDRKTPRFSRRRVSLAKKPSTALSQEHEVGVKWKLRLARPSIAWRLAAGLSATMAVLWIGAAGLAGTVMITQINEAFDQSLRQGALRLLPLAVHEIGEGDKYGLDRVRGSDLDEAKPTSPTT